MVKMQPLPSIAIHLDMDDEDFLRSPETWTEDVAQYLAKDEVPDRMTEAHWKLVYYLRNYFLENGTVPPILMIRRKAGLNMKTINKLFPSGLTKGACRIAGIPRLAILPNFLYP